MRAQAVATPQKSKEGEKMKAIQKEAGKAAQVVDIENTLEALQNSVGGYVEGVSVGANLMMLCDENGKQSGKPYNFDLGNDIVVGNVLFVQNGGDGDFTDIDDDNIKTVLHFFERTPYQS